VKKFLFFFFVVLSFKSYANITLKGVVKDSLLQKGLSSVRIENLRTHQGTTSNEFGVFYIDGLEDDPILFSHVGFKNKVIRLKQNMHNDHQTILMTTKAFELKEVTIKKGPTAYQKDSANRASIYEDAFNYKQKISVASPVTTVYQAFSKKHKQMRHFKEQIENMEQEKFIETKYNAPLVQSLLKINQEETAQFMQQYPMELDYARTASDLEIKMWIKYNYQEFLKKKK
jgi:hypothetical protein